MNQSGVAAAVWLQQRKIKYLHISSAHAFTTRTMTSWRAKDETLLCFVLFVCLISTLNYSKITI